MYSGITFSLLKPFVLATEQTALALFGAGKIHSADQPATANPARLKSRNRLKLYLR